MKTSKELEALKSEVISLDKKLPEMNENEQRTEVISLSKKLEELSEDELNEVTAGTALGCGTYAYTYYIHKNCGGTILNVGDPFSDCVCDTCGETHYWHYSFEYTKIYKDE